MSPTLSQRLHLALALCVGGVLTLSGCTENGGAIFATIEQEQETPESNLPKTITVHVVAVAGEFLIAAASQLYVGSPQGAGYDWAPDTPVENSFIDDGATALQKPGATCLGAAASAAASGGTLYAIFSFESDGPGVYATALPAAPVASDLQTIAWTRLGSGTVAEGTPSAVLTAGDQLFVTTRTTVAGTAAYELHYWDDTGGTFLPLITVAGTLLQAPVADIVFDSSEYWCISGGELFSGDLTGFLRYQSDDAPSPQGVYGGLHYDSGRDALFVSSAAGRIYVYTGGAWSTSESLTLPGDPETALPLTDFLQIGEDLHVGSRGVGFFALTDATLTQASLAGSRLPDRTISELYSGVILRFFPLDQEVFVSTAGAGLWRYSYEGEWTGAWASSGWQWE